MPERSPGTPIPRREDFPVTWNDPDDARLHWTRDTEHVAGPSTPLMASLPWVHDGMRHGYRYWEVPLADVRRQRFHTFEFSAIVPLEVSDADLRVRAARAQEKLDALSQDVEGHFNRVWWPRIEAALKTLEALPPAGASDAELADAFNRADEAGRALWEVHFELVFGCMYVHREFDRFCRDLFGPDTEIGTRSLAAGDHNWSVADGEALFELARFVTAHPELERAVATGSWADVEPALTRVPEGPEFRERFLHFIQVHGQKLVGAFTDPTWDEDPTLPLQNLRMILARGGAVVRAQRAGVVAHREMRLQELRERLRTYPRMVQEEFESLLPNAAFASRLMEDHNFYIDQKAPYHFRRIVMEFAKRLAARGILDQVEDVVFLQTDELVPALRGESVNLKEQVRARRAELERWQDCDAPTELGTVGAPPPPHPLFGGYAPPPLPPASTDPTLLSGIPASRGRVTGVARVCRTLAEASALRPGEILVTGTTNPSWATWFPVLGGLVTEAGGVLSHAAVVAREFGIPAVLAVPAATRRIATGTRLELNGDGGTVKILD